MLSQLDLRSLLHYDEQTGIFTRTLRTSNRIRVGDVAGSKDVKGYICIRGFNRDGKSRWKAQIRVHGTTLHLGCYGTQEEAHEAYMKAKEELHIKARSV